MAKLSTDQFAEQIKAKYPQYSAVDNSTLTTKMLAKYPQYADRVDQNPAKPGFFAGIAQDLTKRAKNVIGSYQQAKQETDINAPEKGSADRAGYAGLQVLRLAGRTAGQVAGAAGDIIGRGVSAILPKAVEDSAAGAVERAASTPVGQKVIQAGKTAYDAIPEQIRPDVGAVASTLTLGGGGKVASVAEDGIRGVLPKAAAVVRGARETRGATKAADTALRDVTPDFDAATKTAKGKLISQSVDGAPRVNEGGIFKSRTLTPTKAELDAAKELASVPGYKSGATALRNFNTVRGEIGTRSRAFEQSLAGEQTIVPKKEIVSTVRGAITDRAEESLLLQGSDPSVQQYLRVVQNAAGKADGTPKGIWEVRKAMDAAYENARGRLAYDSDKVAALDEVHRAGRDALNDLMTKYAKNTDVKAEFHALRNLFHAKDELLVKAQGEKGSVFKRATAAAKRHPVVSSAVTSAATAAGVNELLR